MKKLMFIALAALFLAGHAVAQDTVRTLLHPGKLTRIGLYIAPEFQYGQSNGDFTAFSGASAMLLFNKRLAVGITAQHSLSETFSPSGVSPLVLRSAFGGGKLEYTLHPDAAVHFTFPLLIGMGMARTDSLHSRFGHLQHGLPEENFMLHRPSDRYFVVQPGVQVEANLLHWAKVFAGANYRITNQNNQNSTLPKDALQGLSFNLGLKLGWFDFRLRHKKGTAGA